MVKRAVEGAAGGVAVDELPAHPSRKGALWCVVFGGAGLAFWLFTLASAGTQVPPALLVAFVVPGLFVALGLWVWVSGPAVQRVNFALGAVERGELERAEALLDGVPRRAEITLRQAALIQRALIAFQRADVDAMRAHLAGAQALPMPLFNRGVARASRASARALEALALALAGDVAGAREGARAVRANEDSPCDALASASIAEALCLHREGKVDELAARLRRDRDLIGEHGRGRERSLARALARAAGQAGRSPYREAAEEAGSRGASLGAWAERLVPGLGAFVAGGGPAEGAGEGAAGAAKGVGARAAAPAAGPSERAASEGSAAALGGRGKALPIGRLAAAGRALPIGLLVAAGLALPFLAPLLGRAQTPSNPYAEQLSAYLPLALPIAGLGLLSLRGRRRAARAGGARRMPAPKPNTTAQRVLLSWVALIVAFVAIWQFVSPEPSRRAPAAEVRALSADGRARGERPIRTFDEEFEAADEAGRAAADEAGRAEPSAATAPPSRRLSSYWLELSFVPLMAFFFARSMRRTNAFQRALFKARRAVALGEGVAEARTSLASLARSKLPLDAAAALFELGRLAAREGDFAATRQHCSDALAGVMGHRGARLGGHDWLVPELRALFAYALAALDDAPGAEAELASLRDEHPAFPGFERTAQQVLLLVALRRGDVAEAARLAAARSPDLSMPWRDELLGSLSMVVVDPTASGPTAFERLSSELRDDASLSRWLDRTAPALMNAFRRLDAGRAARAR